jgi:hypothetical protein
MGKVRLILPKSKDNIQMKYFVLVSIDRSTHMYEHQANNLYVARRKLKKKGSLRILMGRANPYSLCHRVVHINFLKVSIKLYNVRTFKKLIGTTLWQGEGTLENHLHCNTQKVHR